MDRYPTGLIIVQDRTRFAKALNFTGDKITLPGKAVMLEMLYEVANVQPTLAVYRYTLVTTT